MKFSNYYRLWYSQDSEAGKSKEKGKSDEENSEKKDTSKEGEAGSKSEKKKEESKTESKTFSQEDVNRIVQERLNREKEVAERAQKEKQGEYEKLYVEIKPKFEQSEAEKQKLSEELAALKTQLNSSIDEIIKDWPEEVRDLDPGKDDLSRRQIWVQKASKLVGKSDKKQAPNFEQGAKGSKGNSKGLSIADNFLRKNYGPGKNN